MKVRQGLLRSTGEIRTKRILDRFCLSHGLRVYKEVAVKAVIDAETTRLQPRMRDYYMTAQFDFVVCEAAPPERPLFAVEFDGSQHQTDATQIERDEMKNQLCEMARLGLVRVGWDETEQYGRVSMLEMLLERELIGQTLSQGLRPGVETTLCIERLLYASEGFSWRVRLSRRWGTNCSPSVDVTDATDEDTADQWA